MVNQPKAIGLRYATPKCYTAIRTRSYSRVAQQRRRVFLGLLRLQLNMFALRFSQEGLVATDVETKVLKASAR